MTDVFDERRDNVIISDPVILGSKPTAARPACCSLPLHFHQQTGSGPSADHHFWSQQQGGNGEPSIITNLDSGIMASVGDVSPPAAGEFVDLNATQCSTALFFHHHHHDDDIGGGGPGLPICDSRRHPLQLANRTFVLVPAAPPVSLEAHWFWDLLLPDPDPVEASAVGRSDRPAVILLLLLMTSLMLFCRWGCCCFFVS